MQRRFDEDEPERDGKLCRKEYELRGVINVAQNYHIDKYNMMKTDVSRI